MYSIHHRMAPIQKKKKKLRMPFLNSRGKKKAKARTRGETGKAFSAAHRNHARMYTCHLGTDTLVTYLTMGLVRQRNYSSRYTIHMASLLGKRIWEWGWGER